MPVPSVKGYMPLSVTLRSQVCDEQGVGQWPMWNRYDSIKGIVDQYIDEPYRDFLALPYYDIDKQKAEEYFYWYTPRTDTSFIRLNKAGDDYDYYKQLLNKTISHYYTVIDQLKKVEKVEEANFLQLALKYAGESDSNVYCGNARVVATVWGMRFRDGHGLGESVLVSELFPDKEIHTVRYDIGEYGSTQNQTILKKSHGTNIYPHQVPLVEANDGYEFIGWDNEPVGAEVTKDLLFVAQYKKTKAEAPQPPIPPRDEPLTTDISAVEDNMHTVRFLLPNHQIISELLVKHGSQLNSAQIPPLPEFEGTKCTAWDTNPIGTKINSDRDFIAKAPEKNGCLGAILNWLLLLLGFLLIFLLLWCFVSGKCLFNLCGCDCEDTVYVIPNDEPVPVPHTGDVQILLSWSNYNDLDISCIDPYGQRIWFNHPSVPSGGELDVDMNANYPYSQNPIENIYWPTGGAPKGHYTVILNYYARHDENTLETPYVIKVKYGDKNDTYTGTLTYVSQTEDICTFIID